MPWKDDNGKPLSGAQQAKRRKAKERERASSSPEGVEDFCALGTPDFADPDTGLDYVRKAQLVAFYQMCTAPELPKMERWKLIEAMSKAIGLTHPRAKIEARQKKIDGLIAQKRQPPAVRWETGVPKSPNARGSRRGPRPIPGAPIVVDDPSGGDDE